MNAEERWTNAQEWETERNEVEIKSSRPAQPGVQCEAYRCHEPALSEILVGRVQDRSGGLAFFLCESHGDAIMDFYMDVRR